jgi:polar amino acid transport system permease protein
MFLAKLSDLVDFSFLANWSYILDFLSGIMTTLSISLFGVIIGIVIGVLLAIGKLIGNKFVKAICTIYINFVRGTPLICQLYMIFYVPDFISNALYGQQTGLINPYSAALIAIGLNSAAYVAEIFRGGILSIDKGQFEASRSLGLSYVQSLKTVILPQAIKNILPSLGNEFISVIKETAIVSVIGLKDLMFYANQVRNLTWNPFPALFSAAIIYFILVYSLTRLVQLWERKLQNG